MKIKTGMRALSLLMVMALLGAVFVPAVSAEEDLNLTERGTIIENNYIPIETSLDHATLYLWEYISQGLDEKAWIDASINKEPMEIYDINGKLLFYQFSVEKKAETVGSIMTPASKVLGISVQSIGEPDSYDIESSLKNAHIIIANNYPDFNIISSKIVCYDYPKKGIMIEIFNPANNKEMNLIFDAYETSDNSNRNIEKTYTGWSYYQQLSNDQFSKNIEHWNINTKYMEDYSLFLKISGLDVDTPTKEANIQSYNQIMTGSKATGESKWISPFPKELQEKSNWCMIASALIITKYYYPSTTRTQSEIASHMGVSTNTCPSWIDHLNYFIDPYSQGGLGKTNTVSSDVQGVPDLTYNAIKKEIGAYRPISAGVKIVTETGKIFSHEKVCIGYWQYTNGDRLYKFSDPADERIYWEAADTQGMIYNYQSHLIIY